jgi:hypothetical protein
MIEEFQSILKEAHKSVEDIIGLEDEGYIKLGSSTTGVNILSDAERKEYVQKSRIYSQKDPLCVQAIRLWTDYTFGPGMSWNTEEESTKKAMAAFWDSPANSPILSPKGQRKCSNKLLTDGEIFFAIFLGDKSTIRTIDPLEITEIITNPDDIEDVRYYKREWTNPQGQSKTGYYRSFGNIKDEETPDQAGSNHKKTQDALIYHLALGTNQRGTPLLLPVLDWVKLYRQFLSSRVAVMLALARFAWDAKVKGGADSVAAIKAVLNDEKPAAGSTKVENEAVTLNPIKTDSGASNAYTDGRMLKLQHCSGVGIPEQYFGDLSTGNLATAKTVELPMMKQFQSYQAIWSGAYKDIDNLILEKANIPEDKRYVDMDFPAIAPEDQAQMALSIQAIVAAFPEFSSVQDVQQAALMSLGINNVNEVLDSLDKSSSTNESLKLRKALIQYTEKLKEIKHV